MKKILISLLVIILTLSLFSCGKIKYDENDVRSAAKELILKSAILDKLFWGDGIEYVEDLNYANGSYYMASPLSLISYGIETVSDIEELTRATFSERYAKSSLESVFGVKQQYEDENDFVYVLVRYYQKYEDTEGQVPICIMVNSKYEPLLTDKVEYLLDTVKVLYSDKERIYVSVDASVSRGDKTQINTVKFALVFENGSYKIDTPTYTSYKETN
jgi:hypothetical protein